MTFSDQTGPHSVTQAGVQWHEIARCSLELLSSSNPPTSASQGAGTTETGFHRVKQVVLDLPTLGNSPTSASQSAGITGMSHCARLHLILIVGCCEPSECSPFLTALQLPSPLPGSFSDM
ncbi:hypothetical protein AAY473_037789 [Plecturocebus cupreus]